MSVREQLVRVEFAQSDVKLSFEVDLYRYPGAQDQVAYRLQVAIRKAVSEEMALAEAALRQSLENADVEALTRFAAPFNSHDTNWAAVISELKDRRNQAKATDQIISAGGVS